MVNISRTICIIACFFYYCAEPASYIELHQLISYNIHGLSINQINKILSDYKIPSEKCCATTTGNKNSFRKCIHGSINGSPLRLTDGSEIPWVLEYTDGIGAEIIPCASSFDVVGDFNIEQYLLAHGFHIKKTYPGEFNEASNGELNFECSKESRDFLLKYNYSAGSGGYGFSIQIVLSPN